MMRRNMQANEIRTNIVFEFAVVGEVEVRQLYKDISNLANTYVANKEVIRLVGINLKKPTANMVYLSNLAVEVSNPTETLMSEDNGNYENNYDEPEINDDDQLEEEEDDNDKESD